MEEWRDLGQLAPRIHQMLVDDAGGDATGIDAFLEENELTLSGYVDHVVDYCRQEIRKTERHESIQVIAAQVRDMRLVPEEKTLQTLGRYQVMLDNELYKGLRAFREAQQWRLASIEIPVGGGSEGEQAA